MTNISNQVTSFNTATLPTGRSDLRVGEPSMPIYLVLMSGGLPGMMVRLEPGETTLGRAEDNLLPIFDFDVSRCHAILRADEGGEVWIEDLGSTNGTFRNGERLPGQVETPVRDGDLLQFGSTVVFKLITASPSVERLLRILFDRAARDQLTGLYNRAYFLDQVAYQAMRGGRLGRGLALMLLDIDHFKRINDTHGHGVGDEVLRMAASTLRESIRSTDMVARYGGEEFILALSADGREQAGAIAEGVRLALAARPIPAAGHLVRVTACLGGVFVEPGRFRDVDELIKAADRALYRAKDAGRDRVLFEDNPPA